MRKKAQTLTLLLLTSRKPDHRSSSSLMPSAPASLPSLPQLSLISNPCNSFVLEDKNSILSNWENQQHNAQSLALLYFPRAYRKEEEDHLSNDLSPPFPFLWNPYPCGLDHCHFTKPWYENIYHSDMNWEETLWNCFLSMRFFPFFSGVINGTDVCVSVCVCLSAHTCMCRCRLYVLYLHFSESDRATTVIIKHTDGYN